MKKLFAIGCIGLLLFEISNVFFIMPMPGSQQLNTLSLAYFLHSFRWYFRLFFTIFIATGLIKSKWDNKLKFLLPILILTSFIYVINFIMAADAMFKQPHRIQLVDVKNNKVDLNRLVIGVVESGKARAYPIQFLGYHHFIYDDINGKDILVTYCTVCRTGRVYSPIIDEKKEQFRLVGMDHFNAMLEDASTKSWWQQATGEAVAGPAKGKQLPELYSTQTSLRDWIKIHPTTLILQGNPEFKDDYDTSMNYESGKSRKSLTGSNPHSGANKSWVVGIKRNGKAKFIDWNELKRKRIVQIKLDNTQVFVVLSKDNKSFFAYENPFESDPKLMNETIILDPNPSKTENCIRINSNSTEPRKKEMTTLTYEFSGKGINNSQNLKPVIAYQEFLHSWKHFSQH